MKDTTSSRANGSLASPARFNKILVATDFSESADHAFAFAIALAKKQGVPVHLLHVIGPVEGDAYSPLRFTPEANVRKEKPEKMVYEQLQSTIKKYNTEGVSVEPVQQHGSRIVSTVLQYARAEDIDLIVMGTHGRQGMQRFIMGSVAEQTVRQAPCAVLTVHAPTDRKHTEKLDIQRILAPVDFSAYTEALVRDATALARGFGAQLDLLHVIEMPLFVGMFSGVMTANDLVPDVKKHAAEKLHHMWSQWGDPAIEAKLHIEEGHAAAHIVDFAARFGTDLIVIASQGRSGLDRFLIGSVAERVVRSAPCPVLTVKVASPASGMQRDEVEEGSMQTAETIS